MIKYDKESVILSDLTLNYGYNHFPSNVTQFPFECAIIFPVFVQMCIDRGHLVFSEVLEQQQGIITVEFTICNHTFYSNSFSHFSLCGTLFRLLYFLSNTIFRNVNVISIFIACFLTSCNFIFAFVSSLLSLTLYILVVFTDLIQ